MKKFTQSFIIAIVLFCSLNSLAGHLRSHMLFSAKMDGSQEVPTVSGNGVGMTSIVWNSTRDTMCINMTFSGLTGAPTGIHIHSGATGVNGGVLIDLTPYIIGNRLSATLTGTAMTTAIKSAMLKGNTYVNVHTTGNPNGEIRGQIWLESDQAYSGIMDGAQEVPAVVTTANGWAVFNVDKDGGQVRFWVVVNGLSGSITGAHLHTGAAGVSGPVAQDLSTYVVGNTIMGAFTPSAGVLTSLAAGNIYINVHTAANPGGEIRGQLRTSDRIAFDAWLNGAQEVPPVVTSAVGLSSIKVNTTMDTLWYDVLFTGLSGLVTSAHLHTGAYGATGPAVVTLSTAAGNKISGMITGAAVTTTLVNSMLSGGVYVNLHTSANPNGEIRGQVYRVMREGFSFSMDGSQEVPAVSSSAKGSGMVSINRDQDNAHYMFVSNGITPTGVHFHKALAGANGGVIYDLTTFFSNNGAFGYWKNVSSTAFTTSNSAQFMNDSVYINMHTSANPNGEIRGQVWRGFRCFTIATGMESAAANETGLVIYPNPANTNFKVSYSSASPEKINISVYDVVGKSVQSNQYSAEAGSNTFTVGLQNIPAGIYFIRISNGKQETVKKLMVE